MLVSQPSAPHYTGHCVFTLWGAVRAFWGIRASRWKGSNKSSYLFLRMFEVVWKGDKNTQRLWRKMESNGDVKLRPQDEPEQLRFCTRVRWLQFKSIFYLFWTAGAETTVLMQPFTKLAWEEYDKIKTHKTALPTVQVSWNWFTFGSKPPSAMHSASIRSALEHSRRVDH